MNQPEKSLRARNLRTLLLLSGLFLLPLIAAFWMYYGTDWRPLRHVNHGELLIPPRPLPQMSLPAIDPQPPGGAAPEHSALDPLASEPSARAGKSAIASAPLFHQKWSLVYIGNGRCDEACRHVLYIMRQTRLSLNNEMTRVERVFLVTQDCCDREFLAREHAGLRIVDASGAEAAKLLDLFPPQNRDQTLFIVDPLGNLLMSYDGRLNPKGLLEDLKKLLTLSQIG